MPTINPRINVTLSPSLYALVGRMAAAQRASRSQVLRELLEAAEPALQRAATLMETATTVAGRLKDELRQSLDKAQDQAEADLQRTMGAMDSLTQDLVTLAETVQSRRPARVDRRASDGPLGLAGSGRPRGAKGPGAQDPPASNRGVKSPGKQGKRGGRV